MIELTLEQKATFNAEIEDLRKRLALRRAFADLPSNKQRVDALKTLHIAVERVIKAVNSEPLRAAGVFSFQTEAWLAEAHAVAGELKTMAKTSRYPILNKGMTRLDDVKAWLIGDEIPKLFSLINKGKPFPVTLGGRKGDGQGIEFALHVLQALGEVVVTPETIKSHVGKARSRLKRQK